jgi:predicted MFS family arabinose efflux permease
VNPKPEAATPRNRAYWVPLLALSTTVTVAFGVLLYSVSVLITEDAAGAVFSTTVLSAGYGGALLVGGILAPRIGRRADRHGVRPIFATGVLVGGLGMAALSVGNQPWHVLAIFWLLIGPAGAMAFYEPAFVAVEQWFGDAHRAHSLATLTVIGGLAGPVFLPLTSALVDWIGWRDTARLLGVLLVAIGLPAAFVLAQTAGPHGSRRPAAPGGGFRQLLSDRRLIVYSLSVALLFASMQGVLLHRIALFEAAGFAVATASLGAAAAGLFSFPGRFVGPFLARRVGGLRVQVAALMLLATSALVAADGSEDWQLGAHFLLFGLAFGAMLPVRATIMGGWYAGPDYGRIMGSQWMVVSIAGAVGPALIGAGRDATGGYEVPMILVAAVLLAAAALTAVSARLPSSHP